MAAVLSTLSTAAGHGSAGAIIIAGSGSAAALRSRASGRRHHRRQIRPRTHRQGPKATTTDILWKPPNSTSPNADRQRLATPRLARKRFDPTQLFAQRDRLPWFWFFVAVAVTVLAALDRYHIIGQFKQRERVVIIDPAQTYYISPLLQFSGGEGFARRSRRNCAAVTFLERNPKDFDHPDLLRQMFLKSALQKAQDHRTREAVEFRAKQLHQKPEIAKIDILATRENEVLVDRLRPGDSHRHLSGEGVQRGVQLQTESPSDPQPQHGCQRSFPHRCRRLQI